MGCLSQNASVFFIFCLYNAFKRQENLANFSSPPFLGASVSESQQPDHFTRRAVELTKPTGNGHLHKLNYKKICSFLNHASICFLERLFLLKPWQIEVASRGLMVWRIWVQVYCTNVILSCTGGGSQSQQSEKLWSPRWHLSAGWSLCAGTKHSHALFLLLSYCIHLCLLVRENFTGQVG